MFDFLADTDLPFSDDQDGDTEGILGAGELETSRTLDKPIMTARKAKRREFVNGQKREALTELIPALPPPDTDLYIIGNGAGAEKRHGVDSTAFDFGTFIPHVVRMLGDIGCTAYVSTWTMNENHVKSMVEMLTDGRLSALSVMVDPYFSRRTPAIYAQLITGLQAHPWGIPGAGGGRFKAFKNHCKIIAIANPAGQCCTIMGSANLSAQPRTENYTLSTAPDLYAWVRDEFFEVMLNAKIDKSE